MEKLRQNREIIIILIFSACVVLISGLTSDLSIGDEVYHYRFAKDMYAAGHRVPFDPLYPTGSPPGYFYSSEPLWSGLLAVLWRLTGHVSFPVAQVYHLFYYLLLIFITYLLGKEIYGRREGVWAALLVSSAPMVVSFSVLFYIDVPGTAMGALSLLLLLKKRYLLAGLGIVLIYFTKRNAGFLVPGFAFALLFMPKENLHPKIRNLVLLILPVLILAPLDIKWRRAHIEGQKMFIAGVGEVDPGNTMNYLITRLSKLIWGGNEYLNSSLINPKDIIQYFGIPLLLALFLYIFIKKNKKEDWMLWVCVFSYFVFFVFLFGINSDIRYVFPVIPVLCILAASSIKSIENLRCIKGLMWLICILQIVGSCYYVHQKRLIPFEKKEGFSFIKRTTPTNALVMYPGYIFIEATDRKFIWSSFFEVEAWVNKKKHGNFNLEKDLNGLMFWNKNQESIKNILKISNLNYIVVDKSKIYDDTNVKHFGGYPKSFIDRLPTFPFVRNIFENQAMTIWEVNAK